MKSLLLTFTAVIVITVMANFGCSDTITNPDEIVFPDSLVSFQNHVFPMIKFNCSYSGCHGVVTGANCQPYLDYFDLFKGASGLVILNEPDKSRLVQIFEYINDPHNRQYIWRVNDNQKKGIRKWISEGAKNN